MQAVASGITLWAQVCLLLHNHTSLLGTDPGYCKGELLAIFVLYHGQSGLGCLCKRADRDLGLLAATAEWFQRVAGT